MLDGGDVAPVGGDVHVEDRSLAGSAVDALDDVCNGSDLRADARHAEMGDPAAHVDPRSGHQLLVAELVGDPRPARRVGDAVVGVDRAVVAGPHAVVGPRRVEDELDRLQRLTAAMDDRVAHRGDEIGLDADVPSTSAVTRRSSSTTQSIRVAVEDRLAEADRCATAGRSTRDPTPSTGTWVIAA